MSESKYTLVGQGHIISNADRQFNWDASLPIERLLDEVNAIKRAGLHPYEVKDKDYIAQDVDTLNKYGPIHSEAGRLRIVELLNSLAASNGRKYTLIGDDGFKPPPDRHSEVLVVRPGKETARLVIGQPEPPQEYRHKCGVRFDLLDAKYLRGLAGVMAYGAIKYGPDNWRKGLTGENSGINHALKHCAEYMEGTPCEHKFLDREIRPHDHMLQVGVNAMFEWSLAEAKYEAEIARSQVGPTTGVQ